MENTPEPPRPYSESERLVRAHILEDWKKLVHQAEEAFAGKESELAPKANWDTIWVLSGTTAENLNEPQPGEKNETLQRLMTGFWLMRQVTAVRMTKRVEEVTEDDVREHGPVLYFNGALNKETGVNQNAELQAWIASGELKEFGIPAESIHFTNRDDTIVHTGDQFEDFPSTLSPEQGGRLVIVTDLYHLPRVKRYVQKGYPNITTPPEEVVLYPALPATLPLGKALAEVHKTPTYIDRGILPEEQ